MPSIPYALPVKISDLKGKSLSSPLPAMSMFPQEVLHIEMWKTLLGRESNNKYQYFKCTTQLKDFFSKELETA